MSGDLRQRLISRLEGEYGQLTREQAVDAILDELQQHEAEALADQTLMRGLTVKDGGINLDLIPPREIAAIWVHCAVEMLGDAPNYTETEVKMPSVSMEISPAGTLDRYALIVQRVGKLTPHEARQQAESERDAWRERAEKAEAAVARVRQLHRVHCCEDGHQRTSTPNPCLNNRICSCGQREPCPTLAAIDDPQER